MAITPLPLPQPGDTNWAGPLNAALGQLNQDVGEISETGQDILDAAGVAQQSATDAEAARAVAVSAAGDAGDSRDVAGAAEVAAVAALGGAETARTEAEAARDLALAGQFAGTALGGALADLNNVPTPGVYYQGVAGNATPGNNYPAPSAGILEVFRLSTSANWRLQRYTPWSISYAARGVWTRRWDGTTWEPWRFIPSQRIDTSAGLAIYTWDDVNSREQMIHGDTGWRDVSGIVIDSAVFSTLRHARLRRTNSIVTLDVVGTITATSTMPSSMPSGFRVAGGSGWSQQRIPLVTADGLTIGAFSVNASGTVHLIPSSASADFSLLTSWATDQAWPTTLPGTPA